MMAIYKWYVLVSRSTMVVLRICWSQHCLFSMETSLKEQLGGLLWGFCPQEMHGPRLPKFSVFRTQAHTLPERLQLLW